MRKPQLPAPSLAASVLGTEESTAHGVPIDWDALLRPRAGDQHLALLFVGGRLGDRLLQAWDAWRRSPRGAQQLHLIVVDASPPTREVLLQSQAHSPFPALLQALADVWPVRTPGWHRVALDSAHVQLTLVWSETGAALADLQAELHGLVLARPSVVEEREWVSLSRLAAPGAWLVAHGHESDPWAKRAAQHGFVPSVESTPHMAFRPRFQAPPPPGRRPLAPQARTAIVVGAGLAGAACAQALLRAGLDVTVLEGGAQVAAGASGNPGGLFHATVHPDDGPHARWNRAAALHLRQLLHEIPLPWRLDGLVRLAPELSHQDLQHLVDTLALPADYVQALAPEALRRCTQLPLDMPAWSYPGGGALPPQSLVAHWLRQAKVRLNCPVDSVQAQPGGWSVLGHGEVLAEADLLVLAAGAALPALLHPLDADLAATLIPQRGQVSWLDASTASLAARPAMPVAAGGYALPLPDGRLVIGASAHEFDFDPEPRASDHAANALHWQRLCGAPQGLTPTEGRVAWRLLTPDRLPLVGGLIDPTQPTPVRATQSSAWSRRPGLVVCGGFGSRGITSSALAGELAAALALGHPAPVERSLIDALDPARFAVRARRKGVSKP